MIRRIDRQEYLACYNKGLTDTEIAEKLGFAHTSVSKFRRKILKLPLVQDNIELTSFQKEVLTGTLLGDSTVRYVHSQCRHPNLTFSHTERHFEYFLKKYEIFNSLLSTYVKRKNIKHGYKSSRSYYQATGRNLKCLKSYRDIFYPSGTKIIPVSFLEKEFSECSLAYLFMDDGNSAGRTINLSLHCFELPNLKDFVELLFKKFNLEFTIKADKTFYLRQRSAETFYNLVKNNITECMKYKLAGIESYLTIKNGIAKNTN